MRLVAAALLLSSPALAQVGAITGERTVASKIRETAAACKAGAPVTGSAANGAVPVTIEVAGVASLQCMAQKLVDDQTFKGIDRLTCDAPDRTVDLRCTLNVALADGSPRYGDDTPHAWALALLTSAVQNELDADRLVIQPDRIELAGEIPSEESLVALEASANKRGIAVRSLGLKVKPRPVLDALPVLAKGTGPATLHVAGLAPAAALVLVGDSPKPFLAKVEGKPLTGTLAAPSRVALAKALALAVPVARQPIIASGTSRKVTLSFQRADAWNVARLLSDAAQLDVAIPRGQPEVAVLAKNVPGESVQVALAKLLGLTRTQAGSIVYYTAGGPPKLRTPAADEPRRTLTIGDGATSAEALALVSVIAKVPACLSGSAPAGPLKLKNVTPTQIVDALRVVSGDPETDAASCKPAPPFEVTARSDLAPLTLLATLTGTEDPRALVRKADGSVAWLDAKVGRIVVTPESAGLQMPGGEQEILTMEHAKKPDGLLADHRVVATLVTPQGAIAVLEGRAGRTRIVSTGTTEDGAIRVEPGKVTITEPGRYGHGYDLRSRVLQMRASR